uniref:Uncharacterized protein n=1 Tax=Ceratitis capitata TaxID=7213 RepID=W8BIE4_CERCA
MSKLNKLKSEQIKILRTCKKESWFVKKTKIKFPEEVRWLLSLGEKFVLPTTKESFSAVHMIAEMEQKIAIMDNEKDKEIARNKLSNRTVSFKRNLKQNYA